MTEATATTVDPDAPAPPASATESDADRPGDGGVDARGWSWWRVAGPGVVALVGLALWRLTAASAWLDEACSVAATQQLGQVLRNTSGTMATYYVVLNGWVRVDDSLWWLRFLSVIFAAAAVLLLAVVARRLTSARVATWACLFLGGSWMLVRYAQEARSFALVVVVVTASWWALDHIVDSPRPWGWVAAHVVLCALVPLTHGLALLGVVVQAVALVLAGVGLRTLLAAAPGLAVAVATAGGLYLHGASDVGTWADPLTLGQVVDVAERLIVGYLPGRLPTPVTAAATAGVLGLTLFGAALGIALARRVERGPARFRALTPVVWGLGTPTALILLSVVRPSMHPRYAIASIPAIALMQATAAVDLQDRLVAAVRGSGGVARLVRAIPVVPLAMVAVLAVGQVQLHRGHDTTWDDLVSAVAAEAEPGDGLYVPSVHRMPIDVAWSYLDDPPPVLSVGHLHPLGTVRRYGTRTDGLAVTDQALAVDRLWVVRAGSGDEYERFMARPRIAEAFEVGSTWSFERAELVLLVPRAGG